MADDAKKTKPDKRTAEQKAADEANTINVEAKSYDEYIDARALDLWSHRDTGHNLSVEEAMFCRSYVIDRNPVAALNRLRYSGSVDTLKRKAKKLLAQPEVQSCIEALSKQLMEKLEVTAEKVQRAIASVAFFDVREVASFDGITSSLLHSRYWTYEQSMAVKSLKMGQHGLELQFYDRMTAVAMLAKQVGLQKEDSDPAEQARAAAEGAVTKIFDYLDRVHPDSPQNRPRDPDLIEAQPTDGD